MEKKKVIIDAGKAGFDVKQVALNYVLKTNESFEDNPFEIGGKIVGSVWIATATSNQLETIALDKQVLLYKIIDAKISKLVIGSIAILLGLKGLSDEEIKSRKELYEILYTSCKDITNSSDILLIVKKDIYNLQNSEDLNLLEYKTIVITQWEQGIIAYNQFKLMIEAVRSKWKLLSTDTIKFNLISDKLDALNLETNPANVPVLFAEIMTI